MEKSIKETLLKEYWDNEWAIFRIKMIDHWQHSDEIGYENKTRREKELEEQISDSFGENYNAPYYKGYYTEKVIKLCEIFFHHKYDNFIRAVKLLVEVK